MRRSAANNKETMPGNPEQSTSSVSATSTSLLARVRLHDAAAWERLVQLYAPLIYRWCRQTGIAGEDVADISQEVLQAVMKNIDAFRRDRPTDSFRGWLWTITRNKIRDHFRRKAKAEHAVGGTDFKQHLQQMPDCPPEETDGSFDANELLVRQAMELVQGEFQDRTWQAFWRLAVEGHSTADIAEDLAMTKKAVRQAKYRVLQRLRQEFGELLEVV